MTDKTPAMPEFNDARVQAVYCLLCDEQSAPLGEHWEGWVARRIVAALQSAQPAAVSDAQIMGCIAEHEVYQGRPGALLHFARVILALRPQAVPMTDEQRQQAFNKSWATSSDFFAGIEAAEAHHGIGIGITAPAGGEGKA